MENPTVVDVEQPRFSWINTLSNIALRGEKQTAYRIRVASSQKVLLKGKADVWDSGKVTSEESTWYHTVVQP
jgi:alpha-L-rhamnosidase